MGFYNLLLSGFSFSVFKSITVDNFAPPKLELQRNFFCTTSLGTRSLLKKLAATIPSPFRAFLLKSGGEQTGTGGCRCWEGFSAIRASTSSLAQPLLDLKNILQAATSIPFLSSPRTESARAVTGRRCPHSGVGEDFLGHQPGPSRKRA